MKTSYFCVQDFSILSPKTCKWRGQGEKSICLMKISELLLMSQSVKIHLTENIMHRGKAKNTCQLNMILLPQQDFLKSHFKIICQ